VKISLAGFGMFIELFVDMTKDETQLIWDVVNLSTRPFIVEKPQHATMYSFFILSGVMDLVTMCGHCQLPGHGKTSKILFSLAFWMEGILFYFHTGGRAMLDSRIHLILTLGVFVCAIGSAFRVVRGSSIWINVLLALGLLFQGTWLCQAAFIIFGSNKDWWDINGHEDAMFVSLIAAWHVLCIVVATLLLWTCILLINKWGYILVKPCVRCLPGRIRERFGKDTYVDMMNEEEMELTFTPVEDISVSSLSRCGSENGIPCGVE
jgi:hypothetical protein